jgi:hypothetical protein
VKEVPERCHCGIEGLHNLEGVAADSLGFAQLAVLWIADG